MPLSFEISHKHVISGQNCGKFYVTLNHMLSYDSLFSLLLETHLDRLEEMKNRILVSVPFP